jgi:hypothetical protein
MTYISGPMTGRPNYNREAFFAAELMIGKTEKTFNPARIELKNPAEWEDYMRVDIAGLMVCDTIYMLDGWNNSKGAQLEHYLAQRLRIKIIYQDTTK